jgi:hypothetical protein
MKENFGITSAQYTCPATIRKCLPNAGRMQQVGFAAVPTKESLNRGFV